MRKGWKTICDRCGFEYYNHQLQKEWNGLMVCRACYSPRHPQDFVRAVKDEQAVPWSRPEAPDTFTGPTCTLLTIQAIPDVGTAGCMIAGYTNLGAFSCDVNNSWGIAGRGVAGCSVAGRF